MKKILSIICISIIIIMAILPTISTAAIPISKEELYSKGRTENLLKWGGAEVACSVVAYQKNGVEYYAYCLNRELPGVGEFPSCTVSVNDAISNIKVWKAIINGYPYKSIAELGCNTEGEAFMATKQAVYCMLYDRDPNTYTAIGEAGERTLNALIQIVNAANNSGEVKISSDLEIQTDATLWKIDDKNNQYISRTFSVSAKAPINKYIATLEGNIPEGTMITDENNQEKQEFKYGEKLKILIPLLNITEEGNFN